MRILDFSTRAVLLLVLLRPGSSQAASCPGDFNGDNQVTIDEILAAVDAALTDCSPAAVNCAGDLNGDHGVSITAPVSEDRRSVRT